MCHENNDKRFFNGYAKILIRAQIRVYNSASSVKIVKHTDSFSNTIYVTEKNI